MANKFFAWQLWGGYYLYINTAIVKLLGWKKGDEIVPRIYGRDALIVKKAEK